MKRPPFLVAKQLTDKSPRCRPRWVSEDDLAADHTLRKAVRAALRELYPDLPRPPGPGWLIAPVPVECPDCDAWLVRVHVPNVPSAGIAYCVECEAVFEIMDRV